MYASDGSKKWIFVQSVLPEKAVDITAQLLSLVRTQIKTNDLNGYFGTLSLPNESMMKDDLPKRTKRYGGQYAAAVISEDYNRHIWMDAEDTNNDEEYASCTRDETCDGSDSTTLTTEDELEQGKDLGNHNKVDRVGRDRGEKSKEFATRSLHGRSTSEPSAICSILQIAGDPRPEWDCNVAKMGLQGQDNGELIT